MWRHISPSLLVYLAIVLTCGAIGISIIGFFIVKNNPGIFVLASALFAISGVILTSAVRLHSEARDAAFGILRTSSYDKELHVNMRVIRNLKTRLEKENIEIQEFAKMAFQQSISYDDRRAVHDVYSEYYLKDLDFIKSIYVVGNFFEGLSIAIRQREINGDILYKYYVGMFVRFYSHIRIYLPYLKNSPEYKIQHRHPHGRTYLPELYEGLEYLYDIWMPKYQEDYICPNYNSQCPWSGKTCKRATNRLNCPQVKNECKPIDD